MIIKTIGIFHLLHSPLLILFPFVIHNFTWDILYITYFFVIMFLYTFIDGECPISYVCKLINDKNYIAGTYVTHYPEMEYLLGNQKYIDSYFGIMTSLYLLTLSFVIFRTNTLSYFVIFTCIILLIYFLLVRNIFSIKNKLCFRTFQEITKYVLFLTICFFLTFLPFYTSVCSD
jgi:hypothetical protein